MKRKAFLSVLREKIEDIADKLILILVVSIIVASIIIGAVVGVHLIEPITDTQVRQYKDIAESIYYNGFANTEIPDSISVSVDNAEITVYNEENQFIIVDFSEEDRKTYINNGKISLGFRGGVIGAYFAMILLILLLAIVSIVEKLKSFFDDFKKDYRVKLSKLKDDNKK